MEIVFDDKDDFELFVCDARDMIVITEIHERFVYPYSQAMDFANDLKNRRAGDE